GYAPLGVERVLLELETEPRDESLRRLDELAELAQLR
ncbi:MAG: LLM class F420-dependent oxidoreductase, partial [Mycobacterium gordonae]|nr:LLM class F420-dependent oxidoreductase [Mycobacterium gordonae]